MKILIEMFCQKLIVSNVTSAFSDHLKPTIFFISQSWWPKLSTLYFKISGSSPVIEILQPRAYRHFNLFHFIQDNQILHWKNIFLAVPITILQKLISNQWSFLNPKHFRKIFSLGISSYLRDIIGRMYWYIPNIILC